MSRAPLWAQITDRLNAALWRAPLPRRLRARLSAVVYRNPPIGTRRVVETLDALAAAGVTVCCMGGWGIDALTGRQNRKHRDLDLIVKRRDRAAAIEALARIGYRNWYEQSDDCEFGDRIVVRDRAMRVVDVHPVEFDNTSLELSSGMIGGRPVLCLSAEQQVRALQGFRKRLLHERRSQRRNAEIARRVLETESAASG